MKVKVYYQIHTDSMRLKGSYLNGYKFPIIMEYNGFNAGRIYLNENINYICISDKKDRIKQSNNGIYMSLVSVNLFSYKELLNLNNRKNLAFGEKYKLKVRIKSAFQMIVSILFSKTVDIRYLIDERRNSKEWKQIIGRGKRISIKTLIKHKPPCKK